MISVMYHCEWLVLLLRPRVLEAFCTTTRLTFFCKAHPAARTRDDLHSELRFHDFPPYHFIAGLVLQSKPSR